MADESATTLTRIVMEKPALGKRSTNAAAARTALVMRPLAIDGWMLTPRKVTIAGKHCESGDVLVRDGRLPADMAVGDVLCTPVTGAYGYSMANNYNKLRRPPVVFVQDGTWRVVVRRENYDDLLRLDL